MNNKTNKKYNDKIKPTENHSIEFIVGCEWKYWNQPEARFLNIAIILTKKHVYITQFPGFDLCICVRMIDLFLGHCYENCSKWSCTKPSCCFVFNSFFFFICINWSQNVSLYIVKCSYKMILFGNFVYYMVLWIV